MQVGRRHDLDRLHKGQRLELGGHPAQQEGLLRFGDQARRAPGLALVGCGRDEGHADPQRQAQGGDLRLDEGLALVGIKELHDAVRLVATAVIPGGATTEAQGEDRASEEQGQEFGFHGAQDTGNAAAALIDKPDVGH